MGAEKNGRTTFDLSAVLQICGVVGECDLTGDAGELGIIANTAAIMGITLGKQMPEVVGERIYKS
jgi:hypothetical protein